MTNDGVAGKEIDNCCVVVALLIFEIEGELKGCIFKHLQHRLD